MDTSTKSQRLLIVDDDDSNRLVMEKHLQHLGYSSVATANMTQALEALRNDPDFDAAILDLQMPGGNGYELLQAIRDGACGDEHRSIPLLACTADVSAEAQGQVEDLSFDGLLLKPYHFKELIASLDAIFPSTSV